MKKNLLMILLCGIMILGLTTGCGNNSSVGKNSIGKTSAGNISGNLANNGLVVENKDYIYHALYRDNGIYKLSKKENSIFKSEVFIPNVKAYDLNIVGDYLYYYDYLSKAIKKTKLDGTDTKIIKEVSSNDDSIHLNVTKDWIYYAESTKAIYKISINGEESQKIAEVDASSGMYVDDGWIYYAGDYGLGKIKIDGTNSTELYSGQIRENSMIIDNGYVYFWPFYYNGSYDKFYRIKANDNDSNIFEVLSYRPGNIYNDWMYIRQEYAGALSKAKVKETNKIDLTEEIKYDTNNGTDYIFVVDDWVYMLIPTSSWHIVEVRQDGSDYQIKDCSEISNVKCNTDD